MDNRLQLLPEITWQCSHAVRGAVSTQVPFMNPEMTPVPPKPPSQPMNHSWRSTPHALSLTEGKLRFWGDAWTPPLRPTWRNMSKASPPQPPTLITQPLLPAAGLNAISQALVSSAGVITSPLPTAAAPLSPSLPPGPGQEDCWGRTQRRGQDKARKLWAVRSPPGAGTVCWSWGSGTEGLRGCAGSLRDRRHPPFPHLTSTPSPRGHSSQCQAQL